MNPLHSGSASSPGQELAASKPGPLTVMISSTALDLPEHRKNGTHQHLAVDIDLSVDPRGGLRLRSGEQRFYEGIVGFRFPMFFSASPTSASGTTTQPRASTSK